MKPENYSLGLIPIFSLFLSATNKRGSISLNEDPVKNGVGHFEAAYNEIDHRERRRSESRISASLNLEAVQ